ncbi:ferredoxin [Alloactinosynnema sp. L-07]|uniref:ferredoxin n=1 Tax=Alloactinosynnema sp. L-07 TaxID=1653480 RepID=UPI0018D2F312|nr:ferredoxin [Alloactinosynnema sp. L-07]
MTQHLKVDMIVCDAHGVCAELVPEVVSLDEWGYPVVSSAPVPATAVKHARKAVKLCPRLALRLEDRG